MCEKWKQVVLTVLLSVAAPWLILGIAAASMEREEQQEPTVTTAIKETTKIQVLSVDGTQEMELTDYLTGVLLGELPASFSMEAKKAQAVVARTYALRVASGERHGGSVCTDSVCCQKYTAPEEYLAKGGNAQAVEEARQAVVLTEDLVLMYQDMLIDATYFSCSGGRTEDAVAVWGADIPYLQSVESPGEELAAHYTDSVCYTTQEFQKALGRELTGDPLNWFGALQLTEGGGVETVVIGGRTYTGTELRKILGLRSTAFTVSLVDDTVQIITRGYGHRVGMSQYGAQAMAISGSTFSEILSHYYQGVELCVYTTQTLD